MANASVKVKMQPIGTLIDNHGLGIGGEVQKFVDSEVLRLCKPYVPFRNNGLIESGDAQTVVGSGEVIYKTPYARYQYYGKVMIGSPPKQVTDIDLQYHGGGKRGAKWFERMKADHKDDILRGAAKKAGCEYK